MNPSIKTLQDAQLKYSDAVESQQKILSVIASQHLPDVDTTRLDAARFSYESAAADVAIGKLNDVGLAEATKAFKSAQHDHEKTTDAYQYSQTVINGLQSKLQSATVAVESAKTELSIAEGSYLKNEIETADREYLELAKQIQEKYMHVLACQRLLAERNIPTRFFGTDSVELRTIGPVSCAFVLATRPHEITGIGKPLFIEGDSVASKAGEIARNMEADSKNSSLFSKAMAVIKN